MPKNIPTKKSEYFVECTREVLMCAYLKLDISCMPMYHIFIYILYSYLQFCIVFIVFVLEIILCIYVCMKFIRMPRRTLCSLACFVHRFQHCQVCFLYYFFSGLLFFLSSFVVLVSTFDFSISQVGICGCGVIDLMINVVHTTVPAARNGNALIFICEIAICTCENWKKDSPHSIIHTVYVDIVVSYVRIHELMKRKLYMANNRI